MNKIIKSIIAFTFISLAVFSCNREGDYLKVDESATAIFLRTISNKSTTFTQNGFTTSKVDLLLELGGPSAKNNLQSLDMYIKYNDKEMTYTGAEKLVKTFSLSDFSLDQTSNLYRKQFTYTAKEMFDLLGITTPSIYSGGDSFSLRFVAKSKDGKTYTNSNLGLDLGNAYYATSFIYNFPIVCPFDLSPFTGDYAVVEDTWQDYAVGNLISVSNNATKSEIYISASKNPYLINASTAYMILKVDTTGKITVTSNESFDYGEGNIFPITGTGSVNFCDGSIAIDPLNFGNFTGHKFRLKKN